MWRARRCWPRLRSHYENTARRVYDEKTETWFFSVVDIIQVLTQQPDYQTTRKYWNKLRERLNKEGSQVVTDCHHLKLLAGDGKMRLTDVANAETLLRLVQSVPSPKAEPIKLWLAKVGYERMPEMSDPARALDRARETDLLTAQGEQSKHEQRLTQYGSRKPFVLSLSKHEWRNRPPFDYSTGSQLRAHGYSLRERYWHLTPSGR